MGQFIHNFTEYTSSIPSGAFIPVSIESGTYKVTKNLLLSGITGAGSVTGLNDLSDVLVPSPSSGEVLKYNGSAWINAEDLSTSGGGGSFTGFSGGYIKRAYVDLVSGSDSNGQIGNPSLPFRTLTGAFARTNPSSLAYLEITNTGPTSTGDFRLNLTGSYTAANIFVTNQSQLSLPYLSGIESSLPHISIYCTGSGFTGYRTNLTLMSDHSVIFNVYSDASGYQPATPSTVSGANGNDGTFPGQAGSDGDDAVGTAGTQGQNSYIEKLYLINSFYKNIDLIGGSGGNGGAALGGNGGNGYDDSGGVDTASNGGNGGDSSPGAAGAGGAAGIVYSYFSYPVQSSAVRLIGGEAGNEGSSDVGDGGIAYGGGVPGSNGSYIAASNGGSANPENLYNKYNFNKILQVTGICLEGYTSVAGQTWGNILSGTITPQAQNSIIDIEAHLATQGDSISTIGWFRVARVDSLGNTGVIGVGTGTSARTPITVGQLLKSSETTLYPVSFRVLDSGHLTSNGSYISPLTYIVQARTASAGNTVYINRTSADTDSSGYARGYSTITLTERL